jgi:hypothetical protein
MWDSLKTHPGVPFASIFTFLGAVAGFDRSGSVTGAVIGALIMSIYWFPVLITAWQYRHEAGN